MKQIFLFAASLLLFSACKKDLVRKESITKADSQLSRKVDSRYNPDVSLSKFTNSTNVTNPYFPVPSGKKYIYEGQTEDVLERIEEIRLATTKIILGIKCIIVNFKAYENGKLIEEAFDWYAQDNIGNVWYFGEAVDNYNPDGSFKDHEGSWEAGVDGAKPGIIMPANPRTGMKYREEYYPGEAEDEAQILSTKKTVTIPLGTYNNCIKTRNWTRLERGINENKYYAPGVGLIKEVNLSEHTEIILVAIE